LKPIKIHET
jgi:hypothetical protein